MRGSETTRAAGRRVLLSSAENTVLSNCSDSEEFSGRVGDGEDCCVTWQNRRLSLVRTRQSWLTNPIPKRHSGLFGDSFEEEASSRPDCA